MSDGLRQRLDIASAVFTYLLTAECCLKLLGYGLAGFLTDGMNIFDAFIVLLSLVDTLGSVSPPSTLPPPRPADMSTRYAAALDATSNTLTALFAVEVAAKLLGMGVWGFASDGFNLFDLLVVALGLLELALTVRHATVTPSSAAQH